MQKIKSKLKNGRGFTLIEMLIVVAIIAILVAVSIPLVNTSLERARIATDAANERAAKAAAMVKYLTETPDAASKDYYYDAVNGELKDSQDGITGYGKCTLAPHNHKDDLIKVTLQNNGTCTIKWGKEGTYTKDAHGINAETH